MNRPTSLNQPQSAPWSYAKSAAEDPVTQLRVGDMAAKLTAAPQLVLRAARLLQAHYDRPELQAAVHVAASSVFQVMGPGLLPAHTASTCITGTPGL
jgi:alkylation response protein AidB-like acyl-CoA dehydrogenase